MSQVSPSREKGSRPTSAPLRWVRSVLLLAVVLSLAGTVVPGLGSFSVHAAGPPQGTVSVASQSFATPIRHVIMVLLENENKGTVLSQGPFEKHLAQTYAFATNYYAVCHPSAGNYLALTSGKPWQCGSDAYNTYTSANIGDLTQQAGLTWGAYDESMPTPCDTGNSGNYAVRHNPLVYYTDIVTNTSLCNSHVVDFTAWNSAVSNNTVPNFAFVTPNVLNDGHNTNVSYADNWLKGWLSPLLNDTFYQSSVFFILYDEGSGSSSGYNGTSGGNVYFSAVSPYVKAGYTYTQNTSHYNLLATTEWLLGTGNAGHNDNSSQFPAMKSMFTTSTTAQYALTGTVTAASTGSPISGATVSVAGGPSTTTSASGGYTLNLANGTYTVTASVAGYVASSASVTVAGSSVTQSFALNLFLLTVSGRVTNASSGTGIVGATVSVSGGSTTTTGSGGNYALNLVNGTYSVTASATGYHPSSASLTVAGQPKTLNFALSPLGATTYTLSGTVTYASNGSAVGGAQVTLIPGSTVSSGSNGKYSFSATNGSYTLRVTKAGYVAQSVGVTISGGSVVRNFALSPFLYSLRGTVTNASNGAAVSGATVTVSGGPSTATNSSGGYSLTLSNGTYSVTASAAKYQPKAASVTISGASASQSFALTPIPPGTYSVSGTVTYASSGAAVNGATVTVTPGSSVTTGATGGYSFSLVNGSYTLQVTKAGYVAQSTGVTVGGQNVVHNFALSPFLYTLTGVVTNASNGAAISGATVSVSGGPQATTTASGTYSLSLGNGTYSVTASVPRYTAATASVTIAGGPGSHNFALTPVPPGMYTLSGTVSSASNGTPISGALVTLSPGSSVTTGAGGGYTFSAVNGSYTLKVSKPGFAAQSVQETIAGSNVVRDFSLSPFQYVLSGTVTNSSSGAPVSGAHVAVSGGPSATTGTGGGYSLSLANGTFSLSVSAAGYQTASAAVKVAGAAVTHNFALLPSGPANYTISGTVVDGDSLAPIFGAHVTLNGGSPVVTAQNGTYSFTVRSGTYDLKASKAGFHSRSAHLTVTGANLVHDFPLDSYKYLLGGTVLSPPENIPLLGGNVSVAGSGWQDTNVSGMYAFQLANGTYLLTIRAAYLVTFTTHVTIDGAPVSQNVTMLAATTPGSGGGGGPIFSFPKLLTFLTGQNLILIVSVALGSVLGVTVGRAIALRRGQPSRPDSFAQRAVPTRRLH
ncbi:MAG: carboxypeptidase regulatory-like domain-containing protein [Thermoplasmata archaeon]|nr:carboxypeptidase regulatory-like domain-containing protein [Thermoplasmata archaeon]